MLPPGCCAMGDTGEVLPTVGWFWALRVGAGVTTCPLSPGSCAAGKEEP